VDNLIIGKSLLFLFIKENFLSLSLLFCLIVGSENLLAQTDSSFFGISYGLSVPDSENTNPHNIAGVNGGATIFGSVGIGGYYFETAGERGSGGIKFDYNVMGLEVIYNLGGDSKNVFVGARAGVTKVKTKASGSDVIFSPYHYGVVSGFNYFVFSKFSVGVDGSYLGMQSSKSNNSGTEVFIDSFHIMSILATFKLWL